MREFFKKEVLDRTYEIFGVRQTDEEKMSDDDIRFLLDGLCQVSKNYEYIPQEEQKKIIRACMLKDKSYRNINLRLIAGWLEENGKKYFVETAHKQVTSNDTNYKPLEGDDRDKAINTFLQAIQNATTNFTTETRTGGGSRLREQIKDLPHEQIIEDPKLKRKERSLLDDYCQNPESYVEPINQKGMETVNPDTEISTRENIS